MALNKKFKTYIFVICVALPLTFVMSFFNTFLRIGFIDVFFVSWLKSWLISFVVAYPVAILVVPLARKIILKINWID
jgi:hypothetical protein